MYTSFQWNGKSVIDYIFASNNGLQFIREKGFIVQPKLSWSDHKATTLILDIPWEPKHLPPSLPPPVPPAEPTILDNMMKDALDSARTAAEQNRCYYGRVTIQTDPLHVYVASSCVAAGKANVRAGSGVFWGPNSRWNKCASIPGRQSDGRAALFAVTLAVLSAPVDRTLVIYSSSQFVIRTFCYWTGTNYTEGWPCKNADIVKVTAELLRNRPAGVIFRYVGSDTNN
ncbi:hypothetical protein B0H11DRAFT_1741637, partial [Mycena galericulata]